MDPNRFRDLADAYGGDLERWPAAERAAAATLAQTAEAEAILTEAAALDAALNAWTLPPPDDLFRARLRRDARRSVDRAPYPRRAAFAQAAAVLLCLFVGAAAGLVLAEDAESEDFVSLALGVEDWG